MTELKTLKDLVDKEHLGYDNKFNEFFLNKTGNHYLDAYSAALVAEVFAEFIRAEAINWIKELKKVDEITSCRGATEPEIKWIKHFFNIKEEDLK